MSDSNKTYRGDRLQLSPLQAVAQIQHTNEYVGIEANKKAYNTKAALGFIG